MDIKAKHLRSMRRILEVSGNKTNFRMATKVSGPDDELVVRIGLHKVPVGTGVIPTIIGPRTLRNSEEYSVPRKDLPKINKTFSTYRTWHDWHGNPHSGYQDQTRKVYPKDDYKPSLHHLYLIQTGSDYFVSTEAVSLGETPDAVMLELANLMLECFGSFSLRDPQDLKTLESNIEILPWELLPAGDSPWPSSGGGSLKLGRRVTNTDRLEAIEHRYGKIKSLNPDKIYRGHFGFNGYYIFSFEAKGIYVLESIYLNNATYVFYEEWETLSKMTKSQVINGDFSHKRIIHGPNWAPELGKVLHV